MDLVKRLSCVLLVGTLSLFSFGSLVACGGQGAGGMESTAADLDSDGDGLTDLEETQGWDILLDLSGFGLGSTLANLTHRHVTSDPHVADTDGDGLDDLLEFRIRTDPRNVDSDGDGLTDADEWTRWFSSPVSVDTDADARNPGDVSGGGPPNAFLFDGEEVKRGLSPTLADTDGDGVGDNAEIDHPLRSPLIAEIPQAQVLLAENGPIDIRLDVTYGEGSNRQQSYGTTTSQATTIGTSSTTSNTWETSYDVGVSATGGYNQKGPVATVTASFNYGWSESETTSFSRQTARQFQEQYARYRSDSFSRTEMAASGRISATLRLRNTSDVTSFRLTNLGIAVRQIQPSDEDAPVFKTLAVMTPALDSTTLAPGETTPPLLAQALNVNPDVIKEFLANPVGLDFAVAYFDVQGPQGIDFDFLAQNTFTRTALVTIDLGDGRRERYRVATNAKRGPGGTFDGITLGEVLGPKMLNIPYETELDTFQIQDPADPDQAVEVSERVLTAVRDAHGVVPSEFENGSSRWVLGLTDAQAVQPGTSFDEIALHAGDELHMVFVRDEDADQLPDVIDGILGTENARDSDQDGLTDYEEFYEGWEAGTDRYDPRVTLADEDLDLPRRVRSNPLLQDTDRDGLPDGDEREAGTDPTIADTDGDGVPDDLDPFPLIPARRFHVDARNPAGGDGSTWLEAMPSPQDALGVARSALGQLRDLLPGGFDTLREAVQAARGPEGLYPDALITDPDGSGPELSPAAALVSEIWVAHGTYAPTDGSDRYVSFDLVDGVGMYGGFLGNEIDGDETRRAQRNEDPGLNETVLTGDIGIVDDPGDNTYSVVTCGDTIREGTVVDGFSILLGNGGHGGGIHNASGRPRFRNLLIADCAGAFHDFGGGYWADSGGAEFSNCAFLRNEATRGAGAYCINSQTGFVDCLFASQRAPEGTAVGFGGGLGVVGPGSRVTVTRCQFVQNQSITGGAAEVVGGATCVFDRCRFEGNTTQPLLDFPGIPDLPTPNVVDYNTELSVPVHSIVDYVHKVEESRLGLHRDRLGGAIFAQYADVLCTQCLFDGNEASAGSALVLDQAVRAYAVNCTFGRGKVVFGGAVFATDRASGILSVRNCAVQPDAHLESAFPPNLATYMDQTQGDTGFGYSVYDDTYWINSTLNDMELAQLWTLDVVGLFHVSGKLKPNPSENLLRPRLTTSTRKTALAAPPAINLDLHTSIFADPVEAPFGFRVANVFDEVPGLDGAYVPEVGSPALDAGSLYIDFDPLDPGVSPVPATDLLGNPRVVGGNIDVGAIERQAGG